MTTKYNYLMSICVLYKEDVDAPPPAAMQAKGRTVKGIPSNSQRFVSSWLKVGR